MKLLQISLRAFLWRYVLDIRADESINGRIIVGRWIIYGKGEFIKTKCSGDIES